MQVNAFHTIAQAYILATTKLDGIKIEGADFTDTYLRKVRGPGVAQPISISCIQTTILILSCA
jgi:hypothetical protein